MGVLAGNVLGFGRVALTAYFLGTHSRADSLAVAMGPMDTVTSVLTNSILFAFVPMLTACSEKERPALFASLCRVLNVALAVIALGIALGAPWLMRLLAPGLDPAYFDAAVWNLRILSGAALASGSAAVYSALLFTERRFAPTAFYQAAINACTMLSAILLWRELGVYAFALGYTAGACVQLGIVWYASARTLPAAAHAVGGPSVREVLVRPALYMLYAAGLGLNMIFTRAWATQLGPGMAAALDYCMRGVGVPLALLVTPVANSLLPEIARLRSLSRIREALRLMDRSLALAALAAVGGCGFALVFRAPVIGLLFQRGSFSAESTALVASMFLGLGPSLIGWALIEVAARSLFALGRPGPAVLAAMVPVALNAAITLSLHSHNPAMIGAGASAGLAAGFAVLFLGAHARRGSLAAGAKS